MKKIRKSLDGISPGADETEPSAIKLQTNVNSNSRLRDLSKDFLEISEEKDTILTPAQKVEMKYNKLLERDGISRSNEDLSYM